MSGKSRDRPTIVIRKEEVVEGGHHGGAWKVAYADFVTAMMAFFLLMWLLNATSEEQKRGIADYFSQANPLAKGQSGSGLPFGGRTPFDKGDMVSSRGTMSVVPGKTNATPDPDDPTDPQAPEAKPTRSDSETDSPDGTRNRDAGGQADTKATPSAARLPGAGASESVARVSPDARALAAVGAKTQQAAAIMARAEAEAARARAERDQEERRELDQAAEQIRAAIRGDRLLTDLARQITIDQTPEGLRIQLLDEDRTPMFASGAAVIQERAKLLLQKVAPVLAGLTEKVTITGHTDATPYRGTDRTNWELSSERANATRRLLVEAGLPEQRFRSVTGNADRDPLLPSDPLAAANRRIAIVVLRSTPNLAPSEAAAK